MYVNYMSVTHSQKGLEKNRDRDRASRKMLTLKVIQEFCTIFSRFLYVNIFKLKKKK